MRGAMHAQVPMSFIAWETIRVRTTSVSPSWAGLGLGRQGGEARALWLVTRAPDWPPIGRGQPLISGDQLRPEDGWGYVLLTVNLGSHSDKEEDAKNICTFCVLSKFDSRKITVARKRLAWRFNLCASKPFSFDAFRRLCVGKSKKYNTPV